MADKEPSKVVCQICGAEKNEGEAWPGELLREGLQQTIKKRYPHWSPTGYVCVADLNRLRGEYVEDLLQEDMGQITSVQQEAVNAIEQHELLSRNLNVEFEQDLTLWERLSDKVASLSPERGMGIRVVSDEPHRG